MEVEGEVECEEEEEKEQDAEVKNMPELTEAVTLLATGCQYQTADSLLFLAAPVTANMWSWSQEWRVEHTLLHPSLFSLFSPGCFHSYDCRALTHCDILPNATHSEHFTKMHQRNNLIITTFTERTMRQ